MKMRLLLTLAGLAIGFAVPTFAQEKDTVDPEVRQQIEAAVKKHQEAYNRYDAAAYAALYTRDAIILPALTFSAKPTKTRRVNNALKCVVCFSVLSVPGANNRRSTYNGTIPLSLSRKIGDCDSHTPPC
jgi:hypothetical protein